MIRGYIREKIRVMVGVSMRSGSRSGLEGNISASYDTYTGTVTILPELTCHTGFPAATRGNLWEDGPER